jgi:hypothetical protein
VLWHGSAEKERPNPFYHYLHDGDSGLRAPASDKAVLDINELTRERCPIMKSSTWSFAVVTLIFAAFASPPVTIKARAADDKPLTLAASETGKQQRANICRARYRDCLRRKQIPSFECRYIYQDCINKIT